MKNFRRGIVEDVDRVARARARDDVKRQNASVFDLFKANATNARLAAEACGATKKAARETSVELLAKAKALLEDAAAGCKLLPKGKTARRRSKRAGATWTRDAAEDCARKGKDARARAAKIRAKATETLSGAGFECAKQSVAEKGKFVGALDAALDKLREAQGTWRSLRKDKTPKGTTSSGRTRKPSRAGERLSEWRQQEVDNFAPEFRTFCKDNFGQVASKAKRAGIELHEACADMAHDAGYAENPAQYLAERNPFEGKKFEQNLAAEQARAMGFDPLEALRASAPKKGKRATSKAVAELIFTLGGQEKPAKKPREKVAKVVDPTTATSAARRTKKMFLEDAPF